MRHLIPVATALLLTSPLLARRAPETDARKQAAQDYALALKDYERTGVDTRLADAVAEMPFLDIYNPGTYAPLGEMPRLPFRGYYLVAPGRYELDGAVFCLHAGAYAPGGGDGYALAPLKGIGAETIYKILYRWLRHPEVPQHDIQLMLWAVVDRVSPDKLSPKVLANANLLLTKDEIGVWRKLARPAAPPQAPSNYDADELQRIAAEQGIVVPTSPEEIKKRISDLEVKKRVAGRLPGGAGRIARQIEDLQAQLAQAQAMAKNPGALTGAVTGRLFDQVNLPYEEIARQAVIQGNPTPPAGSRQIPACRWSYEAHGGLFVRHIPIAGYWRALVQVSVPGPYTLVRDPAGRITGLTGITGARVEVDYAGDPSPVSGHDGLRSARVAKLRYVPTSGSPGTWARESVVVIGQPAAKGGSKDDVLAKRIESVRAVQTQVLGTAKGFLDSTAPTPVKELTWTGPLDALDLSSLISAYPEITGYQPVQDPLAVRKSPPVGPEAAALEVLCEALQSAVRNEVDSLAGIKRLEQTVAWRTMPGGPGYLALALSDPDDYEPPNPFDKSNRKKGPELPQYDPSGGVAQPGNTGRQRLATAAKGSEESEKSGNQANGDGVGDSPGSWFGGWLDTLLDVLRSAHDWLTNDPPRDDFQSLEAPAPPVLPPLEQPEGYSPERWAAAQAMLGALVTCYSDAQCGKISLDRMGGAARAERDAWVWAQARALTCYKRQFGLDMIALADAVDRYRQVLVAEGVQDSRPPEGKQTDDLAAIQRQAAQVLGISVEELEAMHAARAKGRTGIGRLQAFKDFAAGLRAEGAVWSRLPKVAFPSGAAGTPVALSLL